MAIGKIIFRVDITLRYGLQRLSMNKINPEFNENAAEQAQELSLRYERLLTLFLRAPVPSSFSWAGPQKTTADYMPELENLRTAFRVPFFQQFKTARDFMDWLEGPEPERPLFREYHQESKALLDGRPSPYIGEAVSLDTPPSMAPIDAYFQKHYGGPIRAFMNRLDI